MIGKLFSCFINPSKSKSPRATSSNSRVQARASNTSPCEQAGNSQPSSDNFGPPVTGSTSPKHNPSPLPPRLFAKAERVEQRLEYAPNLSFGHYAAEAASLLKKNIQPGLQITRLDIANLHAIIDVENERHPGLNLRQYFKDDEFVQALKQAPPGSSFRAIFPLTAKKQDPKDPTGKNGQKLVSIPLTHHIMADVRVSQEGVPTVILHESANVYTSTNASAYTNLRQKMLQAGLKTHQMATIEVGAQSAPNGCVMYSLNFAIKSHKNVELYNKFHDNLRDGVGILPDKNSIGNTSLGLMLDSSHALRTFGETVSGEDVLPAEFYKHLASKTHATKLATDSADEFSGKFSNRISSSHHSIGETLPERVQAFRVTRSSKNGQKSYGASIEAFRMQEIARVLEATPEKLSTVLAGEPGIIKPLAEFLEEARREEALNNTEISSPSSANSENARLQKAQQDQLESIISNSTKPISDARINALKEAAQPCALELLFAISNRKNPQIALESWARLTKVASSAANKLGGELDANDTQNFLRHALQVGLAELEHAEIYEALNDRETRTLMSALNSLRMDETQLANGASFQSWTEARDLCGQKAGIDGTVMNDRLHVELEALESSIPIPTMFAAIRAQDLIPTRQTALKSLLAKRPHMPNALLLYHLGREDLSCIKDFANQLHQLSKARRPSVQEALSSIETLEHKLIGISTRLANEAVLQDKFEQNTFTDLALHLAVQEMSPREAKSFAKSLNSPSITQMFHALHAQWDNLSQANKEMLNRFSRLAQLAGDCGKVNMDAFNLRATPRGGLEDVTFSTSGLAALTKFAKPGADKKNLHFLGAVADFKQAPSRQKAEAILARFINAGAAEPVDLGEAAMHNTVQVLRELQPGCKPPPTMFDDAFFDIQSKIQNTFSRFNSTMLERQSPQSGRNIWNKAASFLPSNIQIH